MNWEGCGTKLLVAKRKSTVLASAWKDREKPRKTPVKIGGHREEILTRDFPKKKQK
jgi:hypothetical protein